MTPTLTGVIIPVLAPTHPLWEFSSKKPSPFKDPMAEGTAPTGCLCTLLPSGGAVGVPLHKAHTDVTVTEEVTHPLAAHTQPSKQLRLG